MEVEETKQIKIKVDGEEADNLKSALKKISEEEKKSGFARQFLNDKEREVIAGIIDKL